MGLIFKWIVSRGLRKAGTTDGLTIINIKILLLRANFIIAQSHLRSRPHNTLILLFSEFIVHNRQSCALPGLSWQLKNREKKKGVIFNLSPGTKTGKEMFHVKQLMRDV
jgi:hypothetical protein